MDYTLPHSMDTFASGVESAQQHNNDASRRMAWDIADVLSNMPELPQDIDIIALSDALGHRLAATAPGAFHTTYAPFDLNSDYRYDYRVFSRFINGEWVSQYSIGDNYNPYTNHDFDWRAWSW
jgi:hypothetical protein